MKNPDFPKIHCPFIRNDYHINKDDYKKYGRKYQLRTPYIRLVENKINEGYEWVFDDHNTIAVEKLDGTNVSLLIENEHITWVQNRKNVIDPLYIKGKSFISKGIFNAIEKRYLKGDGLYFGEVIGEKLQGNPYEIIDHIFYPFNKAVKSLKYKSFHNYERNFDNFSFWFKDYLKSLYYSRYHNCKIQDSVFAEGVVFYNFKRKAEGKTYMAKLRRNMFSWYYDSDIRIGEPVKI